MEFLASVLIGIAVELLLAILGTEHEFAAVVSGGIFGSLRHVRREGHTAGWIDEFAIFHRCLSDAEIWRIYEAGKPL